MGKWYLIGLGLFVVGAGIYSFLIRPTSEQATNFEAFKTERVAACVNDGLDTKICSCLIEKAARHLPLEDANALPRFEGDITISLAALAKIPTSMLEDAYIRGTFVPSMYKLTKGHPADKTSFTTVKNQLSLRAAAGAMNGCVPDSLFVDRKSYLARGKKYYDVPDHMKRTFLVAEKKRKMIASGE